MRSDISKDGVWADLVGYPRLVLNRLPVMLLVFHRELVDMLQRSLLGDLLHVTSNLNVTGVDLGVLNHDGHLRTEAHVAILDAAFRRIDQDKLPIGVEPKRCELRGTVRHE